MKRRNGHKSFMPKMKFPKPKGQFFCFERLGDTTFM
jgi:hypothetical protein